jgi:membrane-bound lytic murein transglycosylase A
MIVKERPMRLGSLRVVFVLVGMLLTLAGCKTEQPVQVPDYGRELPPGSSALRKVTDLNAWPDVVQAFRTRDGNLTTAVDRSISWYGKPSSQQFFPLDGFSHEQLAASTYAFRNLLTTATTPADFKQRVQAEFDLYQSVGWNNNGVVLFTGYYSPIFTASRTRQGAYQFPLYQRPDDLVSDPITGEVRGRRVGEATEPYPERAEIEQSPERLGLVGKELVWLSSALDSYIVQVNGSARLTMTDGTTLHIGYAGNNGHEYSSIGRALVADGKIDKNRLSLATLRQYFQQHPQELPVYTAKNKRYVFFSEYSADNWPAGALGVKVTDYRSVATDKKIFPRGAVMIVNTRVASPAGGTRPFTQFMLDQDAGGAIRAPGRADLYLGIGADAEQLAGRQMEEGAMYYLILKPERVGEWKQRMAPGRAASRDVRGVGEGS